MSSSLCDQGLLYNFWKTALTYHAFLFYLEINPIPMLLLLFVLFRVTLPVSWLSQQLFLIIPFEFLEKTGHFKSSFKQNPCLHICSILLERM